MFIDATNEEVEQTDREYVSEVGIFTFKCVKVTESTSSEGNSQFKLHLQRKDKKFILDTITVTKNSLWKVAIILDAFKVPRAFNTYDLVERYVRVEVIEKGTQAGGKIFVAKNYLESKLQEAYIPPQTHDTHVTPNGTHVHVEIDEDEIPF